MPDQTTRGCRPRVNMGGGVGPWDGFWFTSSSILEPADGITPSGIMRIFEMEDPFAP